uniref:Retrovirus-related Pol polyprotein from transposon TNT 1-94-like beta-barrel domain-containing protein n=1 Tax=Fagus sylvatica TaxID=28930 RepID=A0A2N9EHM6_FAGSY
MEDGNLPKDLWLLQEGAFATILYRTQVKAYKKKFNVVGTIEKTPQLRVKVNCVTPKKVKFSLPDSATDGGAICDDDVVKDSKDLEHWRKEQTGDKDQKHDDEKDTTTVVDDEEVVVLSVQEQKCEHVDNNNNEWVVDLAATHHVVRTKELFTTYKAENFGTLKMGNTSYSKIVGIGDVCIKTNAMEDGNLPKDLWLLQEGTFAFGLYKTRVKACKKKFNAVGTIEKTPQLRVKVNCVTPKRVKFSLPDSATDGGAICVDNEVKDSKDLE